MTKDIKDLFPETFDVLVGGGGVAGLTAAIAASRQGARTILVEPRPFVGGNAATGLCIHTFFSKHGRQVVYGIPQEFIDRLMALGGAVGHIPTNGDYLYAVTPVDADLFRTESTAMLAESGVTVLYGTTLIDAQADAGVVRQVTVCSKDRLYRLRAKTYIDATGDADLAFQAGAQCRTGWDERGAMQPVSMMLRAVAVDLPKACAALAESRPIYASKPGVDPFPVYFHGTFRRWNSILREMGVYDHDDHQFWTNTVWPNQLNINATRLAGVDGNDPVDLSRATYELTRQARGLSDFLRRHIPGFEQALFLPNAFVGIRETRNIKGTYEINEDDIRVGRKFPDAIGQACFPVDIHHPDGKSQQHIDIGGDGTYDLPYRALIPQGFKNLLAAGRCLSATPYAHGATRNMAPCMVTGQAAGVAAALAAQQDTACDELPMSLLQSTLQASGVYLGTSDAGR